MAGSTRSVCVVGAGAFGGWTALTLQERGVPTVLLDAWGPANSRATSSGETRLMRAGYGDREIYTDWTLESLSRFKAWQEVWQEEVFLQTGVLWFAEAESNVIRCSLAVLGRRQVPTEPLEQGQLARRYPQVSPEGIAAAFLEPEAGVLRARRITQLVARSFQQRGGELVLGWVEPPAEDGGLLERLRLSDGREVRAEQYVFACGPWLPQMFPQAIGGRIRVSKQDVFFFGPPPGDSRFLPGHMPAWIGLSSEEAEFYGTPSVDGRGFKIAPDRPGPEFDPNQGQRLASPDTLASARQYIERRFPALSGAPVLETRVCQYERTANSHLVIDRHPLLENVWIAGGGSGHGFKLGPAVGRAVADLVGGASQSLPPEVRLAGRQNEGQTAA